MSTTLTWQDDDTTMIDTDIADDAPNTNFATGTFLGVGKDTSNHIRRSLLKWTALSDGTIPANAIIVSATLTLTCITNYGGTTRTLRIYRQKRGWVEAEASWNSYKIGSAWQTAGGFGANDCEQTDIGSVSVPGTIATPTTVDVVLTAASIQEFVSGAWTNNGVLIRVDTENTDQVRWGSSSNATAGYREKLVIVYSTGYLQRIVVI